MTTLEKMNEIKAHVGDVHDPEIVFAMNQLYRELEVNLKNETT